MLSELAVVEAVSKLAPGDTPSAITTATPTMLMMSRLWRVGYVQGKACPLPLKRCL